MGYTRHHAIIVTACGVEDINKAHEIAFDLFGRQVSPIIPSGINGYQTFMIAPDGSKEGWTSSNKGDDAREQFVTWLNSQKPDDDSSPYDWVEVQYGDDNKETVIVNHSDAK